MEEKKEMTLGELIQSEPFQEELKKSIKKHFDAYDKAVAGRNVKRNPMMRLREMGAEDAKTMTEMLIGIIDHNSDLPTTLREYVRAICEPVLNKCLVDYAKKFEEEKSDDTEEVREHEG